MTSPIANPSRSLADAGASLWWWALCGIAALNVSLWCAAWRYGPSADVFGDWQLTLSGVYVSVCAYRSVLPRVDLERLVVVDCRLSSIFLGRSAATVAEICFGLQLGLVAHEFGVRAGLPFVQAAAWGVPVCTAVAQVFCWHSILTLNHITQAVESLLWAVGLALMAALLGSVALATHGDVHSVAMAGVAGSVAFVSYVLVVDIPMYLRRHRDGRADGLRYLGLAQGVHDAWHRREADRSWARWKEDALWLTPYFSIGAWISIALLFIPRG